MFNNKQSKMNSVKRNSKDFFFLFIVPIERNNLNITYVIKYVNFI